jgi:hypothetical protein
VNIEDEIVGIRRRLARLQSTLRFVDDPPAVSLIKAVITDLGASWFALCCERELRKSWLQPKACSGAACLGARTYGVSDCSEPLLIAWARQTKRHRRLAAKARNRFAGAHRNGNITGVTQLSVEVASKRLQLMHELVPIATTIAVLLNPTYPTLRSN